jgi:hypothetical protein
MRYDEIRNAECEAPNSRFSSYAFGQVRKELLDLRRFGLLCWNDVLGYVEFDEPLIRTGSQPRRWMADPSLSRHSGPRGARNAPIVRNDNCDSHGNSTT